MTTTEQLEDFFKEVWCDEDGQWFIGDFEERAPALTALSALIERERKEAQILMLKNMKKSLLVAHQGGALNGTLRVQLPRDTELQDALAAEFERNITNLEAEIRGEL